MAPSGQKWTMPRSRSSHLKWFHHAIPAMKLPFQGSPGAPRAITKPCQPPCNASSLLRSGSFASRGSPLPSDGPLLLEAPSSQPHTHIHTQTSPSPIRSSTWTCEHSPTYSQPYPKMHNSIHKPKHRTCTRTRTNAPNTNAHSHKYTYHPCILTHASPHKHTQSMHKCVCTHTCTHTRTPTNTPSTHTHVCMCMHACGGNQSMKPGVRHSTTDTLTG